MRVHGLIIGLCVLSSPTLGLAEGRWASQLGVLDARTAARDNPKVGIEPRQIIVPGTPQETARSQGTYQGPFVDVARSAAQRHGIPEGLFLKLVQQESGWNPNAVSSKGALGLAQLMPQTAQYLGVNPRDPVANLEGGARYLREQYSTFGSWRLALAAYNAGPEAVRRYGGIPPFQETQNYVRTILGSGRNRY